MTKLKVIAAMSGGVDSCAAAILLHNQGYDIVGISMQVWDYRSHGGNSSRATCCAPSDFDDARKISERYDFPFYVFDFEDSFKENVINPFINTYLKGETPNPCLDCNRKVKFQELRNRAKSLGADKVATGHYARVNVKENGEYGLFSSRDLEKDQSYFLYALTQSELSKTVFPVGDMIKPDVRKILADQNYTISSKAESQDICFVSTSVSNFIEKSGHTSPKGKLKLANGTVMGDHEGVFNYTVGQRKGLGIGHHSPLYVLNIDSSDNSVVVGEKHELERQNFFGIDLLQQRNRWRCFGCYCS
jgi:tRNA-specific 2-thiouridylase